jgi:hypothetical protein
MANRFYSVKFGAKVKGSITESATTTAGDDVELRITYDATNNSKAAVINAIEAIYNAIVEETWPPV